MSKKVGNKLTWCIMAGVFCSWASYLLSHITVMTTQPVHGPVSAVSGLIPDQTKINMLVWVGLTLHGLLAVWDVRRSGLGWMV
jgi:hypothetical protein